MAGSAELDAMTSSPPNLGAPAQPNVSVAGAAGATPDNPLSLASLDPGVDSPYKPLDLPQDGPGLNVSAAMPKDQEPQNLGAVNHAGALAYMADKILRGAIQGHEAAVQHRQDQFNKKLAAQQAIYNDQAQQYEQLVKSGVDPGAPELQDARNRVLATWQSVMQTVGERIPQPKPAKGGKKAAAGQGQQGNGDSSAAGGSPPPGSPPATDAHQKGMNLLQRMFDHSKPDDALAAWYEGAQKLGPPVFHATAPMLTPEYRAKVQQRTQTASDEGTAAASTAQLKAQQAQQAAAIVALTRKPNRTPEEDAKLEKMRSDYRDTAEALNPARESSVSRQYVSPDGKQLKWFRPGDEPDGWNAYNKPSSAPSKPVRVDTPDYMIKLMFGPDPSTEEIIKGLAAFHNATAGTTTGTHTVMVPQKDGTVVPVQIVTSSSKHFGSGGAGGGDTTRRTIPTAASVAASQPAADEPETTPAAATTTPGSTPTPAAAAAAATPTTPSAAAAPHVHTHAQATTPPAAHPHGNAGVVAIGDPVGGRLNAPDAKEVTDATKGVNDVKEALTLAAQTARDAAAGKNVSLQDNALVLGWNRAHTQRFNEAEINKVNNLGGATMKLEGNVAKLVSGQLSTAQRNEFIRQMTDDLKVKSQHLIEVKSRVGLMKPGTLAPATPTTPAAAATPETHQWSASAWQKANPKGDVEAAKKAAIAQHYQVVD